MKTLSKQEMLERNKVARVMTEQRILSEVDHPFVANMYCTIQTPTHLHFLLETCEGGELYALLNSQPNGRLKEPYVRFYTAEVLLALQYVHLLGYVYRDLKPENILVHGSGHVMLTDFDLSYAKGVCKPRVVDAGTRAVGARGGKGKAAGGPREVPNLIIVAEPQARGGQEMRLTRLASRRSALSPCPRRPPMPPLSDQQARANSFVGTEEYLPPEIVAGTGHAAAADWWSFGILVYELLYGFTPFRGARRDDTFDNILKRQLVFPEASDKGWRRMRSAAIDTLCVLSLLDGYREPLMPRLGMCPLTLPAPLPVRSSPRCRARPRSWSAPCWCATPPSGWAPSTGPRRSRRTPSSATCPGPSYATQRHPSCPRRARSPPRPRPASPTTSAR